MSEGHHFRNGGAAAYACKTDKFYGHECIIFVDLMCPSFSVNPQVR
jgi:hypothetical protein